MKNSNFLMATAVVLVATSHILPALDLVGRGAVAIGEAAFVAAVGGMICETIEKRL